MAFRGRGGGGGFRGSSGGGGGGRGGFRGGRGGGGFGGGFQTGPPDQVIECGTFMHACESDNSMVVHWTVAEKVPKFGSMIYLQNKTEVGKIDEVFGRTDYVLFTVKPGTGFQPTSFKAGDVFYISPMQLLYSKMFTEEPKPQPKTPGGARGGRGGARGGFGGRGRGGPSFSGGGGFKRGGAFDRARGASRGGVTRGGSSGGFTRGGGISRGGSIGRGGY